MEIRNDENMNMNMESLSHLFESLTDGIILLEICNKKNTPAKLVIKKANKKFCNMVSLECNLVHNKNVKDIFENFDLAECMKKFKKNEKYSLKYEENIVSTFIQLNAKNGIAIFSRLNSINLQKDFNYKQQINSVLRQASSLILQEKNRNILLESICNIIAENLEYELVWITFFKNNSKYFKQFYSSDKSLLINDLVFAANISCVDNIEFANIGSEVISIEECSSCSFFPVCKDFKHYLVPLTFNNISFGALVLLVDHVRIITKDEHELIKNISDDLGFALFHLDVQDELEIARKKVREYYTELDNQNKLLVKLNEDLKTTNDYLATANRKADESEILKSNFLANISHEIRTPLNGILGFIQLLKQTDNSSGKIDDYIEIINFSGMQLLSTINSILDISKIESGQLTINLSPCSARKIFDDLSQVFQFEMVKNEQIDFVTEIENKFEDKTFFSDESKLKQIINVLLQNAYKFTRKGVIKLGAKLIDDFVLFYVSDSGIGIKQDKFNIIFNSFRQSDESNTRKYGGIGLGLSIAKGLVELLSGEIWLDSELGKGTTFYFKVPYLLNENNNKIVKAMDLNSIETLDWSSRKILIVEDDLFSAEYLAEALEITKVKIVFAKNGIEAVEKVHNEPDIDLILMDIQLPGLSGDKAAAKIREFNSEIPIIAQTAHAMLNDKDSYIKAGCTDYISKPISINELFSVLCKYL